MADMNAALHIKTPDLSDMLLRDNKRMREAGSELAEAAMRVIRTYDGTHRLSLAVSKWCEAIAAEGDRPHLRAPTVSGIGRTPR